MNRGAFRIVGLGFAVLVASAAGCSEETEEDGTGGSVTTQTGTGGGTTQTGTGGGTTQTGTGGGTTQTGTGMGGGGGDGGGGGNVPMGCGDDTVNGLELCDGTDLDGNDCTTLGAGFGSGTLACNANCGLWDVSSCVIADPVCGNDVAEFAETCDGADMGGATGNDCTDYGYTGGTVACDNNCQIDLTGCTGGAAGWTCYQSYYGADDGCDCGCGAVDPDCADATAASCDFCTGAGPGSCNPWDDCGTPGSTINATNNAICDAATCGNDIAQALEICDGTDLRTLDCTDLDQAFTGGTLACSSCAHDTSGCTSAVCGDDTAEGFEWCDGTDLGGRTCADLLGYGGGTLVCDGTCNFDTSGCTDAVCGDDTADGYEHCDGSDLGVADGATCEDAGFTGGTFACTNDCLLDFSTCTGGQAGWTCLQDWYGDGECDCGCGVVDSDCADATVGSCDWCGYAGSCSPAGVSCPSTIDPADNSQCI